MKNKKEEIDGKGIAAICIILVVAILGTYVISISINDFKSFMKSYKEDTSYVKRFVFKIKDNYYILTYDNYDGSSKLEMVEPGLIPYLLLLEMNGEFDFIFVGK